MAVNPDGRPLAGRWIIASAQHLIERSTLGGRMAIGAKDVRSRVAGQR